MDNGETILSAILSDALEEAEERMGRPPALPAGPPTQTGENEKESKQDKETHSQWALGGNGRFVPVGSTVPTLSAGIYEPFATPGMWGLEKMNVSSDGIYMLPDMATEKVLDEVQRFWGSEDKYRRHNLLYKRGIILWGPPGGGKTIAVKLLMNELVRRDGIVVVVNNVGLAVLCLKAIRRIEPTRNLIVVFEDIDEIIYSNGESGVLSMLDGENNIDNILHLATTNYPEKLGARIINRPSRFDNRVYVGMPSVEARESYLRQATGNQLDDAVIKQWIEDTDGMSIAHLRELVAAVYCLDQPYGDVVSRLKAMHIPVKDVDGFKRETPGFGGSKFGGAKAIGRG